MLNGKPKPFVHVNTSRCCDSTHVSLAEFSPCNKCVDVLYISRSGGLTTLRSRWCRGAESTLSFRRPVFLVVVVECGTNGGLGRELPGLGVKLPRVFPCLVSPKSSTVSA